MKGLVVTAAALATVATAGCTAPTTTSSTKDSTTTITASASSSAPDAPTQRGPTTAATARSCPFLGKQSAADRVGLRLDAIKVLSSGGKVIGCRFYPLGHPNAQCNETCLQQEHLPPPSQAVIEIASAQYASATDAHAAAFSLGTAGTNPQQAQIAPGVTGVCFQTEFYPKDRDQDWACAFNKRAVLVLVHTATTESFNAVQVAKGVAPKF
ncbi:MAG: hypothetical protein ACR2LX_11285 [Jatrophihabitans sp.]